MNYPRTNYEMTEADLEKISDACKPVPYMVIGGVAPRSQQDNANDAWAELGARMGFDSMTVEPAGRNPRFFTAVPNETDEQKKERLEKEAAAKLELEIATLRKEIEEKTERLQKLTAA